VVFAVKKNIYEKHNYFICIAAHGGFMQQHQNKKRKLDSAFQREGSYRLGYKDQGIAAE
jgi:hypothetical protein